MLIKNSHLMTPQQALIKQCRRRRFRAPHYLIPLYPQKGDESPGPVTDTYVLKKTVLDAGRLEQLLRAMMLIASLIQLKVYTSV